MENHNGNDKYLRCPHAATIAAARSFLSSNFQIKLSLKTISIELFLKLLQYLFCFVVVVTEQASSKPSDSICLRWKMFTADRAGTAEKGRGNLVHLTRRRPAASDRHTLGSAGQLHP